MRRSSVSLADQLLRQSEQRRAREDAEQPPPMKQRRVSPAPAPAPGGAAAADPGELEHLRAQVLALKQVKADDFDKKAEIYRETLRQTRQLWLMSQKKMDKGKQLKVRRDPEHFLRDSCKAINRLSKKELVCTPIWIKFDHESGVDEGGLTREFWSMISEILGGQSDSLGSLRLFERICDDAGAAFLPAKAAHDDESLGLFEGLGKLMFRLLLDSAAPLPKSEGQAAQQPLGSGFGLLALRYIMYFEEGMSDISVCHASGEDKGYLGDKTALLRLLSKGHGADSLADSMQSLLDPDEPLDDTTTLGTDGLCLLDPDDPAEIGAAAPEAVEALAQMEMREGDRSKEQAVIGLLHHKLVGSRRPQLDALRRGFMYATDLRYALKPLSDDQLQKLLWQPWRIDAEQLVETLQFEGFDGGHRTEQWLGELLRGADQSWLRSFARWCTGTGALPTKAAAAVQRAGAARSSVVESKWRITVRWEPEVARFPTASTCARSLELPEYRSAQVLGEKLRLAVQGMEFTEQ